MQKFLVILCLSVISLYADGLNWAESFDEAMAKAKAQNKDIMVLITTNTCRWCRKLESQTLSDAEVYTRLNKNYISVHLTRGEDEYPRFLEAPGVPTTYFLNHNARPLIKRVMGYWNVEDYLSFLDDVDYKTGKKEY